MSSTTTVRGITAPVTIHRDAYGIPHIEARHESDAWFGMGFACAEDRLWQMDWYLRRGTGRWAEIAGPGGLAADRLFRRLDLARAARADVEAMSPETLAMFESYAAGVNEYVATANELPPEFEATGTAPETWEPWHSVLCFLVRHVGMGKWQLKLANARLLATLGPERYRLLDTAAQPGATVVLPPGGRVSRTVEVALADIEAATAFDPSLFDSDGGSNSWAVHGSRTTTGRPVICNDSHRPLDVPNVYWQAHVSCPEFNVAGAAFAGFPAFPHFAHNGEVTWNITHGSADTQDLYVEEFDPDAPANYRTPAGWVAAETRTERIDVRGATPEILEHARTRHGPVIHGDPRSGAALALRWTATDRPSRQWECLRPLLTARTVGEVLDSQRGWVEPVNNLVVADSAGSIGYLLRGRLPVRASTMGRTLPVPGWTGDHEWTGDVPFEHLPGTENPPEGYIATANQRILDGDEPYIAHEFAPSSRADRLAEVLGGDAMLEPGAITALQADTVSVRAREWVAFLRANGPFEDDAERARWLLAGWDADLAADSAAALLYAHFRREMAAAVLLPIVGAEIWRWVASAVNPATRSIINAVMTTLAMGLAGEARTPDGEPVADRLEPALAAAWQAASATAGPDPSTWRWSEHHATDAHHPLAGFDVAGLDPRPANVGGDADTVRVSVAGWAPVEGFPITGLSVYRQVVDYADPGGASWIIPGGASGIPGSPHYADQVEPWERAERIPMHHALNAAREHAVSQLKLTPEE